jgi:L-lactate dehydrogenase complex protein LldF
LSGASSLCGACTDACPVRIDLHHHLLHNRRNAAKAAPTWFDRIFHGGFDFVIQRPRLFAFGGKVFRATLPVLQKLPLPYLRAWMKTRDLPKAPAKSFRDQWKESHHG